MNANVYMAHNNITPCRWQIRNTGALLLARSYAV